MLGCVDPAAAAEAARTAAGHMRRAGARDYLAFTIFNLGQALMMLGDWDAVEAELTQAADADGLAENEIIVAHQAWLAAMRGDADRAQVMLADLPDLRASQEPQTQAQVAMMEAFTEAARRRPEAALRHARTALAHAGAVGLSHDALRWAWPLAVRTAWELGDTQAVREQLAMIDALQPGQLTPMLRAERDLARARLASENSENGDEFAAAITGLRELSTPYHLAHGLLDYAAVLSRRGETEAAAASPRRGHRDRRPAPLPAAAGPGRGADARPGRSHGSSRCTSPNSCHRYPDVIAAS